MTQPIKPKNSIKKNLAFALGCGLLVASCGAFGLAVESSNDMDTLPYTSGLDPSPLTTHQPMTTISADGTWDVGTDIVPGTYHTSTATSKCIWGIYQAGTHEKVIFRNGLYAESISINLQTHEEFVSYYCGTWIKDV